MLVMNSCTTHIAFLVRLYEFIAIHVAHKLVYYIRMLHADSLENIVEFPFLPIHDSSMYVLLCCKLLEFRVHCIAYIIVETIDKILEPLKSVKSFSPESTYVSSVSEQNLIQPAIPERQVFITVAAPFLLTSDTNLETSQTSLDFAYCCIELISVLFEPFISPFVHI